MFPILVPKITDEFGSLGASGWGWYGMWYSFVLGGSYFLWWGMCLYAELSVKVVCLLAILIFNLGTLVCTTASDSATLMMGRAIVAFGASGMYYAAFVVLNFGPKRPNSHKTWIGLLITIHNLIPCLGLLMGGIVVYVCCSSGNASCLLYLTGSSFHGAGRSIFVLALASSLL